jgi:nitrate reductase beta subunit
MGLVQQPWVCGDRAIGASGYCGLIMYDLSFVENTGLSRELSDAVLRVVRKQRSDFCST